MTLFVGTAGWTVPKQHLSLFMAAAQGMKASHLERYASRLRCVEVNSSFYRSHRRATWERWAAATPANFRFSVKAPKSVTHTAKLVGTSAALLDFFEAVQGLGNKLGPVLFQLPPKLAFDQGVVEEFCFTLRTLHFGAVVLEARHPSWFNAKVDSLLEGFEIARVAADPPKGSELAAVPGGWSGLSYWRLHGAPHIYYSDYDERRLETFTKQQLLRALSDLKETWVIFDNTAMGHATGNAVLLESAYPTQRV